MLKVTSWPCLDVAKCLDIEGGGKKKISLLEPVVYAYKTGLNGQVRILSSSENALHLLFFLGGIMDC